MNLHGRIISLRGDIWAHITSLIPPRFIEVPVLIQKSERVTFCVLGVSVFPLYAVSDILFWNCFDIVVFCFFQFIRYLPRRYGCKENTKM
jgi:nitrate reductase NapE component